MHRICHTLPLHWIEVDTQEPDESESCVDGTDSETCPEEDSDLDSDGSIDDAESSIGDAVEKRGWTLGGDLRLSYVHANIDITDEQSLDIDQIRTRWRLQSSYGITERLRVNTRLAGLCSNDECQPKFYLEPEIPTPVSIEDGQITLDELFLHWFRTERFDLAIGRLQTKFVTRGGVYAKSLDRNDSNNLRINWTEGKTSISTCALPGASATGNSKSSGLAIKVQVPAGLPSWPASDYQTANFTLEPLKND